jgi:hypothetical protein
MGRSIFISYRRDDTEGEAGRLFDDLTRAFGDDAVFMDVDGIRPGVDFRKAIDENVSGCGVLLALVGKQWLTVADSEGNRRLDHENDYVRLEIASALGRNIAVIPVLVHEAHMPHSEQLPENLKDLAYRNSVELTHARWNSDVNLLIDALKAYVAPSGSGDAKPVHATIPAQLPPANAPMPTADEPAAAQGRSRGVLIGVLAGAITTVLGLGGWFITQHGKKEEIKPAPAPIVNPTNPDSPGGNGRKDEPQPVVPPMPAKIPDWSAKLLGMWTNPSARQNNGLSRLEITRSGAGLTMHAWGNCRAPECDWNSCTAVLTADRLACDYQIGGVPGDTLPRRVASVAVQPAGDQLDVKVTNTFAGHPPTQFEFQFDRAR